MGISASSLKLSSGSDHRNKLEFEQIAESEVQSCTVQRGDQSVKLAEQNYVSLESATETDTDDSSYVPDSSEAETVSVSDLVSESETDPEVKVPVFFICKVDDQYSTSEDSIKSKLEELYTGIVPFQTQHERIYEAAFRSDKYFDMEPKSIEALKALVKLPNVEKILIQHPDGSRIEQHSGETSCTKLLQNPNYRFPPIRVQSVRISKGHLVVYGIGSTDGADVQVLVHCITTTAEGSPLVIELPAAATKVPSKSVLLSRPISPLAKALEKDNAAKTDIGFARFANPWKTFLVVRGNQVKDEYTYPEVYMHVFDEDELAELFPW